MPDNALTVQEAARLSGHSPQNIRRLIAIGALPAERFGDVYAIQYSAVAALPKPTKGGRPAKPESALSAAGRAQRRYRAKRALENAVEPPRDAAKAE